MKESSLVVKTSGTKEEIASLLEKLEKDYYVVATSPYKENTDNNGFHRFVNLVPKEMVNNE